MPLLATVFRTASRLRGARAFHPRGGVWEVTWRPATGTESAATPLQGGPRRGLLRVSHGVGLPADLPDVLGWALKIRDVHGPGRDQDLLLASTGSGRLGRHLLRPARDLGRTTLSTLLPYAVAGGGHRVIVAHAVPSRRARYAEVLAGRAPLPRYAVRFDGPSGPLLGTVEPVERAATSGADLRFDPWHTGPDLRPVGWLNRIRRSTYRASQEGRGAAGL